jgi:hypothetical protein
MMAKDDCQQQCILFIVAVAVTSSGALAVYRYGASAALHKRRPNARIPFEPSSIHIHWMTNLWKPRLAGQNGECVCAGLPTPRGHSSSQALAKGYAVDLNAV